MTWIFGRLSYLGKAEARGSNFVCIWRARASDNPHHDFYFFMPLMDTTQAHPFPSPCNIRNKDCRHRWSIAIQMISSSAQCRVWNLVCWCRSATNSIEGQSVLHGSLTISWYLFPSIDYRWKTAQRLQHGPTLHQSTRVVRQFDAIIYPAHATANALWLVLYPDLLYCANKATH